MAATGTPTPNIGLRRPQGTDPASVDDINYNSGVIDTKMGAVGNTSLQAQINTLNSQIITKEKFEAVSTWGNYFAVNTTIPLTKDVTQAKAVLVQVGWNQSSSGYAEPIYYKMLVGEYYNVVYALNNTIKTITFTLTSGTLITITGSTDSDIGIRMVYAVF